MALEVALKAPVPNEVENEIILTSLLAVEANIVLHPDLMEHIKQCLIGVIRQHTVLSAGIRLAEVALLKISTVIFNLQLVWHKIKLKVLGL